VLLVAELPDRRAEKQHSWLGDALGAAVAAAGQGARSTCE